MSRFRAGEATYLDVDLLNTRVIDNVAPPPGIQVATYTNKDRDAINAALFDNYTKINTPSDGSPLLSACLVFMDDLYMNDSSQTHIPVQSNKVKRFFYEHCSEGECNQIKLLLYRASSHHCRLKL